MNCKEENASPQVVFVVVLGGDLVRSTEHLGISYITAVLRKHGAKVEILEIKDINDIYPIETLLHWNPKLVGFSLPVTNMGIVINIINLIRSKGYVGHITAGGHMATFLQNEILTTGVFDSLVNGEGEETVNELWNCIIQQNDWKLIEGISYKVGEKIVVNPARSKINNLDKLPFPARDQFDTHGHSFHYLRISTSRGCFGGCAFCSAHAMHVSPAWRGRSPENIISEIKNLVRVHKIHTFDFVDSTFEDPPKEGKARIEKIARLLINSNLKIYFNCCFRAENWDFSDRPLLKLLSNSGLEKVNVGLEAGNDRGLKILGKRATNEDNKRLLLLLREYPEIYLTFGFIMFQPFVTLSDIRDNIDFLYGTGIGQVSRHYFWRLELYPATRILESTRKEGLLIGNYSAVNGMYKYNFQNSGLKKIAEQCSKFLNLKSVWDYEIFDIVLHTFIWRPLRNYPTNPHLNELLKYTNESRSMIAKYNKELLYRIIEGMGEKQLTKEIESLDKLLLNEMGKISAIKLRVGLKLMKMGIEVPKR